MRTSAAVALLGAGSALAGTVQKRDLQSVTVKGNGQLTPSPYRTQQLTES